MHSHTCKCQRCQSRHAVRPSRRWSEDQEMELAMELLSVSSEAELDQFLGKIFKGITKIGGKLLKPLGGALKGLAKKALPMLGGALGSFIPIPGVGTAIGTAVGGAVSKALKLELELEFEQAGEDELEFETARRVVRIATDAAQRLQGMPSHAAPEAAVRAALMAAARQHVAGLRAASQPVASYEFEADEAEFETDGEFELLPSSAGSFEFEFETAQAPRAMTGRWQRRNGMLVVLGA